MGSGAAAEHEEGGAHAFALECIEHATGRAGFRAVIEGEHDFLRLERQRLWKMLATDARIGRRIDDEHALG